MPLTSDTYRIWEPGFINEISVAAGQMIYQGAAVGIDATSGYARPLQAGDPFVGFAESPVDNRRGAAGDTRVRVREEGKAVLNITGLVITDIHADVYASDDATFTLTSTGNTKIGYVPRWAKTGTGVVKFAANY